MKIDVLCKRELNFEGSGGSQNRRFLRRVLQEVKRAPLGGMFGAFDDFWVPIGAPKGTILGRKCIFFEAWKLNDPGRGPGGGQGLIFGGFGEDLEVISDVCVFFLIFCIK